MTENTNQLENVQKIAKQMLINKALENKDRWGVHESHCCPKHGCKYGDEECPVVLGLTQKHNEHCEMCEDEKENPTILDLVNAYCEARIRNTNDVKMQLEFESITNLIVKATENKYGVIERAKIEGWW